MQITVYTTPACVQCAATKRQFEKRGIIFDAIDLTQHPDLAEQFKQQGLTSAPIVVAGDRTWSGFRLDRITDLQRRFNSEGRGN
jgi:glutaredoxin-like protein NrdH